MPEAHTGEWYRVEFAAGTGLPPLYLPVCDLVGRSRPRLGERMDLTARGAVIARLRHDLAQAGVLAEAVSVERVQGIGGRKSPSSPWQLFARRADLYKFLRR